MDPTLFVGTIDFTMGELQMAKGDLAGVAAVPSITSNKNLPVLSGGTLCPATLFDGDTHFGIAVAVEADGKESYLMKMCIRDRIHFVHPSCLPHRSITERRLGVRTGFQLHRYVAPFCAAIYIQHIDQTTSEDFDLLGRI